MADTRAVVLDRHETRVVTSGDGEPALVCLHGLVDDATIWDKIAPGFDGRAATVRYDQRGHGEAGAPPGPYSRDDLADDVVVVMDRLEIDRAILVGHSMGGIVAMVAALRHPRRVSGLVLIGTTSQVSAKAAAWYDRIADAGEQGLPGIAAAIYGADSGRTITGDATGIAEVTRTLTSLHTDPLTPTLSAIECPALLVVGEHDPLGVKGTEICARELRDSQVVVVDGAGHWVHVDAPDAVLTAFDEWHRS